ncbi:MAG: CapA family protein [Lachnospiraceae bacterium]|nr:CapA family protein [Lachnospiraceae bacterium]
MMKKKLKHKIVVYGIMASVCIGAILYLLWRGGAFLPRWIIWETGTFQDALGQYETTLAHKRVSVRQNDDVVWTSPKGLRVQQALCCDVDNDRQDELVLLCWRIGRYGKSKPFWVEENERKWSQHIAVYEYNEGNVRPKWMSSYIGFEVKEIAGGSRTAYVRATEDRTAAKLPQNRLFLTDRAGKVTCWFWDSWGFTKEMTDVSFAVFGDNLIHEPIYQYGLYHEDFSFLFEHIEDVIEESDITVINQETPLTDNPAKYSDYPRFGTPVQVGEAISDAGFDVVTCATNHALDQGVEGIDFTKKFFGDKGIACLGIQTAEDTEYQPYDITVRNGVRFAMLNFSYGTNGIALPKENPYAVHLLEDEGQVRADIEKAKSDSDFVIVFVHWGTEYARQPDEFQEKWTQIFFESGVDVAIGTHPHALQPYEMLQGSDGHEMLVYYSIGNYISAQSEKSCVKGGMAEFTVSLTTGGYRITEYGLKPLVITWEADRKCTVNWYMEKVQ